MAKSTRGYCKYCGKEYTRTGMLKHLQSCKKRMEVCENSKKMSAYYELMLYGTYNKDYWLIIQIKRKCNFGVSGSIYTRYLGGMLWTFERI